MWPLDLKYSKNVSRTFFAGHVVEVLASAMVCFRRIPNTEEKGKVEV